MKLILAREFDIETGYAPLDRNFYHKSLGMDTQDHISIMAKLFITFFKNIQCYSTRSAVVLQTWLLLLLHGSTISQENVTWSQSAGLRDLLVVHSFTKPPIRACKAVSQSESKRYVNLLFIPFLHSTQTLSNNQQEYHVFSPRDQITRYSELITRYSDSGSVLQAIKVLCVRKGLHWLCETINIYALTALYSHHYICLLFRLYLRSRLIANLAY